MVSTDPVQMGSCSSNHGNAKTGVEDRWRAVLQHLLITGISLERTLNGHDRPTRPTPFSIAPCAHNDPSARTSEARRPSGPARRTADILPSRTLVVARGPASMGPPATTADRGQRSRTVSLRRGCWPVMAAGDSANQSEIVTKGRCRRPPSCDQIGMPPTTGGEQSDHLRCWGAVGPLVCLAT